MDNLRDGQDLFYLELSGHHLETYRCAIIDCWVVWNLLPKGALFSTLQLLNPPFNNLNLDLQVSQFL